MTLGGANVWSNFSYGYRNESPSGWLLNPCLLYTSDAADDMQCVDLGGRRIIKQ